MGDEYEGWDDTDTLPGVVDRFDKTAYRWVTVEKSRFPERWAQEHMRGGRDE